jgi:glycogen(starch) synthase
MRILFWSDGFWPLIGGVEVLGIRVLRALRERGHHCMVLTQHVSGCAPCEDYCGILVHRVPYMQALRSSDPQQIMRRREEIVQIRQSFGADVLWLYNCGPLLAFFYLNTLGIAATPVLFTLHGVLPYDALTPQTAVGKVLRRVDWVTTCSDALLSWLLQRAPELGPRASVIHNALEQPAMLPSLPFDPPVLACIGRLDPSKGFDVALSAFARLLSRAPRPRLLLVGDGDARASLAQQASALGIAAHVEFTGWVEPSRIPHLLAKVSVVIVPTRAFESFSLVALQAAQLGRPVVATRTGGLPEVVLDGETGLLVEPDDPGALAQAIATLLDEPALATRLGEVARLRTQTAFTWERHVIAYEQLLTRLSRAEIRDAH